MSKRKGVSAEEKRTRMLQLFYEHKTFFQLKELEKIAPKEKGIIVNSVKEVIDSLVDAGLVDTDKIGTSVYYWAFPSKARNAKKRKLDEVTADYENCCKKLKETKQLLEKSGIKKDDVEERNRLLTDITDMEIKRDELKKKLKNCEENDPEIVEDMKKETENVKIAANRWTDNVLSLKTWCRDKFCIESARLDKQFGIPENFDYLE